MRAKSLKLNTDENGMRKKVGFSYIERHGEGENNDNKSKTKMQRVSEKIRERVPDRLSVD